MEDIAHKFFSPWESYYVIVGSAAAALIGLQFVVIVLISDLQSRADKEAIAAFGTPTVIHFCATLLTAVLLSAPWTTLAGPRVVLLLEGVSGFGYALLVAYRARQQIGYKVVFEDWFWHMFSPAVAYASIAGAAILMIDHEETTLFIIAGAALLLLFAGIHNAWDTVTWIASQGDKTVEAQKPKPKVGGNKH